MLVLGNREWGVGSGEWESFEESIKTLPCSRASWGMGNGELRERIG
jgi:hypothetical protein